MEKRAMKRKASAAKYAAKIKRSVVTPSDSVNITIKRADNQEGDDYDDGSSSESSSLNLLSDLMESPSTSKPRGRGKVNLITPEVAAALDRTNTSYRKAAYILSAMVTSGQLKCNTEEVVICPNAIRRARMKHRDVFSAEVKATFDPVVPLILHWDGKIIEDFTSPGKKKVDRLPILVSGQNVVKLLSVPKLCNGTAVKMSEAVIDCMDEWGLRDRIKGMCFDTTASNAGTKGGVCLRLQKEIGWELLHLAFGHHISEIMLEKVFGMQGAVHKVCHAIFGQFLPPSPCHTSSHIPGP